MLNLVICLLAPDSAWSLTVSAAQQVVSLTAELASMSEQQQDRRVTLSASVSDSGEASLGGASTTQVPRTWTASDAICVARLAILECERPLVLGGGESALFACEILSVIMGGETVARTSPFDTCPSYPGYVSLLEKSDFSEFDRFIDFAGSETSLDSRYISFVRDETRSAIEDGLFSDEGDQQTLARLPLNASILDTVARALIKPTRRVPNRRALAFLPLKFKLGNGVAADEYMDFLTWPRDVDSGRRLGIDEMLGSCRHDNARSPVHYHLDFQ